MRFTGVVLNFDGVPDSSGEIFTTDCKIEFSENIKVTHEFKNEPDAFLGVAKLIKEPSQLRYEIDITVEKIPKKVLDKCFPAIGGQVISRNGKKITECRINQVGLSVSGNADPRIKPLGEQK